MGLGFPDSSLGLGIWYWFGLVLFNGLIGLGVFGLGQVSLGYWARLVGFWV